MTPTTRRHPRTLAEAFPRDPEHAHMFVDAYRRFTVLGYLRVLLMRLRVWRASRGPLPF